MDILAFKKIKFTIRNLKNLTLEQIATIETMNEKQKEEIILIYNEVLKSDKLNVYTKEEIDGKIVQIGANATVGYGYCKISKMKES